MTKGKYAARAANARAESVVETARSERERLTRRIMDLETILAAAKTDYQQMLGELDHKAERIAEERVAAAREEAARELARRQVAEADLEHSSKMWDSIADGFLIFLRKRLKLSAHEAFDLMLGIVGRVDTKEFMVVESDYALNRYGRDDQRVRQIENARHSRRRIDTFRAKWAAADAEAKVAEVEAEAEAEPDHHEHGGPECATLGCPAMAEATPASHWQRSGHNTTKNVTKKSRPLP